MAFSDASIKILRENPELRREITQKLSQLSTQTVKPTKAAKKAVQSIEQQETRILGSDAYRQAFNETVKPEMRPLQPVEDCFDKGYMQEEAFWNDRHNRVAYSYGQNPRMKGLLRSLCDGDGTRALIESRRAEARALSEVAPKEELKINVPTPKVKKKSAPQPANKDFINKASAMQEKSYKESVDNETKAKLEKGFKSINESQETTSNKVIACDKELIKVDDKLGVPVKELLQTKDATKYTEEINRLKEEFGISDNFRMAYGKYYDNGIEVLPTDPKYNAIKKCHILDLYANAKELL